MMHPIEPITPTSLPPTMPPRGRRWLDRCLTAAMLASFALAGLFFTSSPTTATTFASVSKPTVKAAAPTTKPERRYVTKNIEDIREGDYVLAREEHGTKLAYRQVVESYRRTSYHLRHLTFEAPDGTQQTLQTTDEHPFWHAKRNIWLEAGHFKTGDLVTAPDGRLQTLTATHRTEHPEGVPVFNFQVEGAHTYFVANSTDRQPLLVHNANCHIDGGIATIDQALGGAEKFLGPGYTSLPNGRYLSADQLRQVRLGDHELKNLQNLHIHFEAYNIPANLGGKVFESTFTKLIP